MSECIKCGSHIGSNVIAKYICEGCGGHTAPEHTTYSVGDPYKRIDCPICHDLKKPGMIHGYLCNKCFERCRYK